MLLLIPGPVTTRPEVRVALRHDFAPWDNDFRPLLAGIRERVLHIAQDGLFGSVWIRALQTLAQGLEYDCHEAARFVARRHAGRSPSTKRWCCPTATVPRSSTR